MINTIKKHKLALFVCLVLFIIPFFWHKFGEVDYGGDSTRLYLYNPWLWLKNIALFSINSLPSFGEAIPNFSLIPFLMFLSLFKIILFSNSFLLNNFVNGIILSGSFITVYFICDELFNWENDKQQNKIVQIISGLFFVFSPLLIYSWERALYSFINQILAYPLVFLFILKYLKYGKIKYLFIVSLVCFFFAMNFSFPGLPWVIAFFSFSLPFFVLLAAITNKNKRLFKGLLFLFFFCLLVNSFDIIPNIYTFLNPSIETASDINTFNSSGLAYFLSVYQHVRLVFNITGQDQFNITSGFGNPMEKLVFTFGIKFLFLYFFYPITIALGLILKNKSFSKINIKIYNLLLIIFLVILFFMNAGFSSIGLNIYKIFFRFPFFSMFRAFYSKFSTVYIFFYSLLLGISLKSILNVNRNSILRKIYVMIIFILIIINGWPLVSGRISNSTLWKSDNVSISTIFNPDYQLFLDRLLKEDETFKILSLPLTNENYQVLKGKEKGVYFGPSTIGILAGKNTFSGAGGFSDFWPVIKEIIVKNKHQELNKIFGLLNIGYLFYDSDNYIYDSFPNYSFFPYSDFLKCIFPDQIAIGNFVRKLNVEKIFSVSTFNLFKVNNSLPIFYIPEKIVFTNGDINILSDIIDFAGDQKTAYFFLNQNDDKANKMMFDSKTDELYLKAEPQNIDRIDEEAAYLSQVFYPYVSKKPGFIWQAGLLIEQYQKYLKRRNMEEIVSQNIFYANKRINELVSFNEFIEKRINLYKTDVNNSLILINNISDTAEKLLLAEQLSANLKSNLIKLKDKEKKFHKLNLLEKFISESLQTIETKNGVNTREMKYSLTVPISGEYEILANNLILGAKKYSLTVNNKNIFKDKDILKKDDWISFGRLNFEKGNSSLSISIKDLFNLLSFENWREGKSTTQKNYIYQEILEKRAEAWYEVSGELKEKGKLKIIVAENIGKPNDGQRRLSDLSEYRIIKEVSLNNESRNFSIKVKFSYGAKTVGIFIYDQETGNFKKDDWRNTLSSIKIEEIVAPSIILKLINNEKPELATTPKITILKINPTKYKLFIEGAKEKYGLVMSHGFDKGWKINFENNNTDINDEHYKINGYANMWKINPKDTEGKDTYHLVVEYHPQRLFYLSSAISIGSILLAVLYFKMRLKKRKLK